MQLSDNVSKTLLIAVTCRANAVRVVYPSLGQLVLCRMFQLPSMRCAQFFTVQKLWFVNIVQSSTETKL